MHVRDLGDGDAGGVQEVDAGDVRDTDPLAQRLGPPGLRQHWSWLASDTKTKASNVLGVILGTSIFFHISQYNPHTCAVIDILLTRTYG